MFVVQRKCWSADGRRNTLYCALRVEIRHEETEVVRRGGDLSSPPSLPGETSQILRKWWALLTKKNVFLLIKNVVSRCKLYVYHRSNFLLISLLLACFARYAYRKGTGYCSYNKLLFNYMMCDLRRPINKTILLTTPKTTVWN